MKLNENFSGFYPLGIKIERNKQNWLTLLSKLTGYILTGNRILRNGTKFMLYLERRTYITYYPRSQFFNAFGSPSRSPDRYLSINLYLPKILAKPENTPLSIIRRRHTHKLVSRYRSREK